MGGLAGIGVVCLIVGLCCMYWWKWAELFATYLMLVGGVCLAAAGAGPVLRAGGFVESGSTTVAGWLGAASAGLIAVIVVLAIHVGRALYPSKKQKKPVTPDKTHQWAAFAVPVLVVIAGGVAAVAGAIVSGGSQGLNQLAAFLGS